MNRLNTKIIISALGVLLLILLIVVGILSGSKKPTSYTDSVTGQQTTGSLPENGSIQMPGVVSAPLADLRGFDLVSNVVNNDSQSSDIQEELSNFLLAHSGMESVSAGIQQGSVIKKDQNTIQFIMVTSRPQSVFRVSSILDNDFNIVTSVNFQPIGDNN